jgi:3-oxoacyl-[acyl-carrier protein] reductase
MSTLNHVVKHADKIALVTGASRGIGKAIALALAADGAFVYGTATSEAGATQISQYLKGQGQGLVLNIADSDSINTLVNTLAEAGKLPDIFVANAGIAKDNLIIRMKDEEWLDVIQTNLTGNFYLTKALVKPMLKKRWGRIVLISSVSALMGNPGQSNYAAAKAGLIGFGKSLALELASRNITTNMVAPGFIATDMTNDFSEEQQQAIIKQIPMGEMGQPEDIAAIVNFLASQDARYITGETIQVNGGLYIK